MNKKDEKPYHISVLKNEVLQYLDVKPGGIYVDATFGGGGHTKAILEVEPDCSVIAMDWDLKALELNGELLVEQFGDRLSLVWSNFTLIDKKLKKEGYTHVDGILADFGTSFEQLTKRDGFSFLHDTPLDMRMSPAHQQYSAADVVNSASENVLYKIFREFGQEPKSRSVAREIVFMRKKKRIKTTGDLLKIINPLLGPRHGRKIHPATKIFQALRIYVNKELDNIIAFLPAALRLLSPGGRLVCISFHSLEDRLVKQFFKKQEQDVDRRANILTNRVVVPSEDEKKQNPASRSARLRALELV